MECDLQHTLDRWESDFLFWFDKLPISHSHAMTAMLHVARHLTDTLMSNLVIKWLCGQFWDCFTSLEMWTLFLKICNLHEAVCLDSQQFLFHVISTFAKNIKGVDLLVLETMRQPFSSQLLLEDFLDEIFM